MLSPFGRKKTMKRTTLFLAILIIILNRPANADPLTIVDAINATATADSLDLWNEQDVGWLYTPPTSPFTPGTSYTITDIGTEFGTSSPDPFGVTVEIFENSNLPTSTGTLIASGALTAVADTMEFASLNGGAGVTLDSGVTYLIAFLGVQGLGENVVDDLGATSVGNWYYYNGCEIQGGPNTGDHSQPIIEFADTDPVPEPSTWALLIGSLAGLAVFHRLRERTATAVRSL
jgi:hypothetical protein